MAKYLSVCSGIEAVSVSWKSLGWKPVGFSEIEKFPCEVLKHHYPSVPNLGDMTNYKEWQIEKPDIVIGGTPCQSFSIAGLRKGLEDPRGNLTLTFIGLLDHFKPTWFVWENVPGVLSNNKGRDFHTFIEGLQEIGYSLSWRVLDAQFFGVPQRRKRVFVVGHRSTDWRYSYKTLFESESLSGYLAKSRNKRSTRQATATTTQGSQESNGVAYDYQRMGQYGNGSKSSTKLARDYKDATDLVVYESHPNDSRVKPMGKVCSTVAARWGTGGNNTPLVKVGDINEEVKVRKHSVDIHNLQQLLRTYKSNSKKTNRQIAEELSIPMTKVEHWFRTDSSFAIPSDNIWLDLKKCIGIEVNTFDAQIMEFEYREGVFESTQRVYDSSGKSPTLTATNDNQLIHHKSLIRRLSPIECERLQGFPDDYTNIRGDKTPYGARYKALGNSMAVPVIEWIGRGIQKVEEYSNG